MLGLPITDGQIRLGDEVWDEPPRAFRSADRRPIGVVFQDYLLVDHLRALENVAFGLRARGVDKRAARADALRWLETLPLDASTTLHVRAELGQHLDRHEGRTLLVTHDPLDAMVLADRLVIIESGHVVQAY